LASSTNKKVQIRRFDRESLHAFVNPATFLADLRLEFLTLQGSLGFLDVSEIKMLEFVRDFGPAGEEKKAFVARPKLEGLWVRFRFRDGDTLEGVVANNLVGFDRSGFMITPPDFVSNRQKVFIPRQALVEALVLGVVGSPLKKPVGRKPVKEPGQITLFD
jgi:hypothetical protein